jgi:hypothetical protein
MNAQNLESEQSSSGCRKKKMADKCAKETNPAVESGGLCKKRKIADNYAKKANPAADSVGLGRKEKMTGNNGREAKNQGYGRGRPGLARDTRRVDIKAQEMVDTYTSTTDSNRSHGSPRTGEWRCSAVQEDRTKRIHADPVPDMDPDPDPGPQQHLIDTQGDGNEGIVIALRSLQASFMAMSGRSWKNGDFPQFDGTSLGYLRFRRLWSTFQEYYYASTPKSDLVDILRDRCMNEEIAYKIRQEETMEGCWKALDKFYCRPMQSAEGLMAENHSLQEDARH